MKIVMDAGAIVAALRSPAGASAELLRRTRRQEIILAARVSLFTELEALCQRPEHTLAAERDEMSTGAFLDGLTCIVEPFKVHFLWRPQLRDTADELVLEAAVNLSAPALLTFNIKHFASAAKQFGLRVMQRGPFF